MDHSLQVLDKLDEASDALKQKLYEKVKVAPESGTELVSKRVKAIKLADESEYGWVTVNEYLSDELASDSDDEKRIYRAERRAGRKINKEKRRRVRSDEKGSGSSSVTVRLLRRDSRLRIWLLVRKLDQLVVWGLVLR